MKQQPATNDNQPPGTSAEKTLAVVRLVSYLYWADRATGLEGPTFGSVTSGEAYAAVRTLLGMTEQQARYIATAGAKP